ncbi:uncharacterized protein LOC134290779 [Aedes albopictus]|uniref:Integrase catalytic domain-containing protein n=1 Tax=Aedes albopictus TaxID=7160 RepID=A0ABM1Y7C6_AEDAL
MADCEVLIARRDTLLATLGRAEAFVANYDAGRDQGQVPLRLSHVDNIWSNLEAVQGQLEDTERTAEGRALHADVRAGYETRLFAIKADLLSKMPPTHMNARNPCSAQTNSALSGIKLPTISLPEFDGDYQHWLTFHDTFVALIHSNAELPDIQKFHYLRAAVKGEAAQSIESIAISSANYNLAWDALKGRYSNEYLMKKRHLQALFDVPRMKKESATTLHGLVDEFERHVKVLRQLGEPTDSWSSLLEHLLCTRLHDDTLKVWEDHASTVTDPNYDCLIGFLQRRIRVLESISVNHHAPSGSAPPTASSSKKQIPMIRLSSCSSTASTTKRCPACNQPHPLGKCFKFQRLPLSERQQIVNAKRLCTNCLKSDHSNRNCPSELTCRYCNRRHHSLLHYAAPDASRRSSNDSATLPITTSSTPVINHSFSSAEHSEQSLVIATDGQVPVVQTSVPRHHEKDNVFLLTVIVNIVDSFGHEHPARALLDSASQPNLITERLASMLRLRRSNVNITVQGAGKLSKPVRQSVYTEIRSQNQPFSCDVNFLVMDKVTADLPSQNISTAGWNIPKELVLADPSFNKSQPIDLVLGARHFYSFFPSAARLQLAANLPVLVDSVFGWIVAGSSTQIHPDSTSGTSASSSITISMVSLEESIERFWKTEELVLNDGYSVEERHCETVYQSSVERNDEGRYIVRMPRQPDFDVKLGASKANALRRFQLLEKRLERDAKLKEDYHAFMQEYLDLGHMRLVGTHEKEPAVAYYLPHHPVFKDSSTTTKVRVVFDASAKTSTGYSLNEALSVGPVVQDDLLDIMIRFRTFKVAVVGDIAKMYRQVLLHPDDRSLVRIFFRFTPSSPVQVYELLTVTYGLAPSSYLATRTLKQLADDEGEAYPLGGPALRKSFYVDDFIGGAQSVQEAIRLRTEMSELLAKGGFELRKWTSNELDVLQGLKDDQIGTQSSLEFSPNETVKALGICWEPEADTLRFDSSVDENSKPPTKRSILSAISRLFDPLGLIAPVVVKSKILMQELWLLSCGWDDPVPEQVQQKWENIRSELPKISSYRVDRYALLPNSTIQLHTFSDASESAYGACIYARCENAQGQTRICLLASKSRVAPLKRVSLPRLELCAAVLGAHLYDRIKKAIGIDISTSFFWSDSAITLQWIRSPPNTWKTYVGNRVSEIQHFTHGCIWNHVAGYENPADLVSRGMTVAEFVGSNLWRSGPDWLARQAQYWPTCEAPNVPEEDLEIRTVSAAATATSPPINSLFLRWSSYTRLLHVVAHCQRFVANCRAKTRTQPESDQVTTTVSLFPQQLAEAKTTLVRLAQNDSFVTEIKALQDGQVVGKRSPLRKLSPFVDPERVLRVGGRLSLSKLPYQSKHPALLPKSHPFTRLVAEHYHKKLLHGGGRALLAAMREEFWPIDGRRLVRNVVRACFRCYRLNPVAEQQQIGQLPAARVIPSRPFSVVGVDYAGPFYLKAIHKRAAPTKAYLCLFVCFATKAVHLELVSELSTSAFLATLRRFISRRGRPSDIHSDNGKNFEGASNDITQLYDMLAEETFQAEIVSTCAAEGTTWHFTPPKAPHFGGLWESAIKVAKKHLYRQIGTTRLSYEDMSTVLAQVEAIMNSRPLLPMNEDPDDLAALTPGHFLVGTSLLALPDPDFRTIPTSQLDHYWKLQSHIGRFWHHWQKEYIQELQKDTKGHSRNEKFLLGQLVIIVDEQQPTLRWPLARIVAVHPGNDNITRVVSLLTAKGVIKRPIAKICLLPFVASVPDDSDSTSNDELQLEPALD